MPRAEARKIRDQCGADKTTLFKDCIDVKIRFGIVERISAGRMREQITGVVYQLLCTWSCTCGHSWNTFDTGGVCPACLQQWMETQCLSCTRWSAHSDWYAEQGDILTAESSFPAPMRAAVGTRMRNPEW